MPQGWPIPEDWSFHLLADATICIKQIINIHKIHSNAGLIDGVRQPAVIHLHFNLRWAIVLSIFG
jgi:hypothetical protein